MPDRRRQRKGLSFTPQDDLGVFANFSPIVHAFARLSFTCQIRAIQQVLVETLQSLNSYEDSRILSVAGVESEVDGNVGFEVGIAEGNYFNYLSDVVAENLLVSLDSEKVYLILDFLLIVTYHYNRAGKRISLKFDHHHIRFRFEEGAMSITLYHVKGPQRMALEDLLGALIDKLEGGINNHSLGSVTLEKVITV